MTLEQIEQRLDALQAEKDKLTAELERLKAEEQGKEVKPWRAEYYTPDYTIKGNGNTHSFTEKKDEAYNAFFRIGNYYRTFRLAEQDAEELELCGRVRQLRDALCEGYQFVPGGHNFFVYFDVVEKYYFVSTCSFQCVVGIVYFDTSEHAQQACDILNAERRKERGGNG